MDFVNIKLNLVNFHKSGTHFIRVSSGKYRQNVLASLRSGNLAYKSNVILTSSQNVKPASRGFTNEQDTLCVLDSRCNLKVFLLHNI